MKNRYSKQNSENENTSSDYLKNLREGLRSKTNYRLEQAQKKYGNADKFYQREVNEIVENVEENQRNALVDLVRKLEESNLKQEEILKRLKGEKYK